MHTNISFKNTHYIKTYKNVNEIVLTKYKSYHVNYLALLYGSKVPVNGIANLAFTNSLYEQYSVTVFTLITKQARLDDHLQSNKDNNVFTC